MMSLSVQHRARCLQLGDGTCLKESLPIIEYLEELYPEPPLIADNELARLPTALERLDRHIGEGPFVCGERVTIADCTLLAAINFARIGQVDIVQTYNNITRWFNLYALRHL